MWGQKNAFFQNERNYSVFVYLEKWVTSGEIDDARSEKDRAVSISTEGMGYNMQVEGVYP